MLISINLHINLSIYQSIKLSINIYLSVYTWTSLDVVLGLETPWHCKSLSWSCWHCALNRPISPDSWKNNIQNLIWCNKYVFQSKKSCSAGNIWTSEVFKNTVSVWNNHLSLWMQVVISQWLFCVINLHLWFQILKNNLTLVPI